MTVRPAPPVDRIDDEPLRLESTTQSAVRFRRLAVAAVVAATAIAAAAVVLLSVGRPATASSVDESSPSNAVSGLVNALGSQHFASTYGGIRINGPEEITVLVARPDQDLVAAVDALVTRQDAALGSVIIVRYAPVTHSIQQLRDLTMRLAQDEATLAGAGFPLDHFGPDTNSNTVSVTLQPPPSPSPNYIEDAQAFFDDRYGSGLITIQATTELPATAVDEQS